MPGLNRRGPMNEGAMTGRGRGLCTGTFKPGQGFGAGMGLGRRRCQASGYGAGWGRNSGFSAASPAAGLDAAGNDTKAALQSRADMLEAEIAQIKQQLGQMPESSE